ncbi:uncharacterized protein LOC124650654 [Lolium rigidum]|uniref:uncharacterized protein LOC124650654 n=1 Tax=Lolium rigidum TaxID=89674 RepID=UPI001F5CEBBF|nr:uncharacterized protein LOC124650654 [Lolium rigidum]
MRISVDSFGILTLCFPPLACRCPPSLSPRQQQAEILLQKIQLTTAGQKSSTATPSLAAVHRADGGNGTALISATSSSPSRSRGCSGWARPSSTSAPAASVFNHLRSLRCSSVVPELAHFAIKPRLNRSIPLASKFDPCPGEVPIPGVHMQHLSFILTPSSCLFQFLEQPQLLLFHPARYTNTTSSAGSKSFGSWVVCSLSLHAYNQLHHFYTFVSASTHNPIDPPASLAA